MKKSYRKPEINFESFGISSSFANTLSATCAHDPTDSTQDCGYSFAGTRIFTADVAGCETVAPDGYFGICYYIPTGDNNVFAS
ncbi:MAG: hypothetical protein IJT70_02745 [Clostridia bacterium]|nr:hypothetical protein [Clostridia bacterium]